MPTSVPGRRKTKCGGAVPFRGYGPEISPGTLIGISGIDFEHPLLSAVIITKTAGASITNNLIRDVQPAVGYFCADPPDCTIRYYFTEGRAIKFLGNGHPDHDITGQVIVSGNVIRHSLAALSAPIVFDEVAANVTIDANVIDTTEEAGVLMLNSSGDVTVSHNIIVPGVGDATPLLCRQRHRTV